MNAGCLVWALTVSIATFTAPALAAEVVLDYGFFKAQVEPIFLRKRADHVRCYVCHSDSNNAFSLEKLAPGMKSWNEEQSRHNFEVVSRLVVPSGHLTPSEYANSGRKGVFEGAELQLKTV